MSKAKRHLPSQFVEITRRTAHRRFFLRPGDDSRELVGYLYGKALLDHQQEACVASCMSNHIHSAQYDLGGERSGFMQQFFSNVGRKRNLQLRRRENFWAAGKPGDMAILDIEAIVDKVLYVALQPVAAGLVERVQDWTGFQILPSDWGKPMRFERIDTCGDTMPQSIEFVPLPPPGFRHLPLDDVVAFFNSKIAEKERQYATLRKKKRQRVVGILRCERISPFACPSTNAPIRCLNPLFGGRDKARVRSALGALRAFRSQLRSCVEQFRSGFRDVNFPAGTLQMVRLAGVGSLPLRRDDPHLTNTVWTEKLHGDWVSWRRLASAA